MDFKIESLKDYIGIIPDDDLMELAIKIYMISDSICIDYPDHLNWFLEKQLPQTLKGDTRNILFVKNPNNNKEIIAMSCLKKTEEECKICTLLVKNEYRNKGLGTALMEESMKWLGTTKPFACITDSKLDMFKSLIDKYGWELTEVVDNYYNNNHKEYCYNGKLIKEDNKDKIKGNFIK